MLSVLHSQHYACWCSNDFMSQCISLHSIDPQSRNIPSAASAYLKINVSKFGEMLVIESDRTTTNIFKMMRYAHISIGKGICKEWKLF